MSASLRRTGPLTNRSFTAGPLTAGPLIAGVLIACLLGASSALAACSFGAPEQGQGSGAASGPRFATPTPTALADPPVPDTAGVHQVVATGLEIPWGVAFLPDGAGLVTERATGRILRVGPESDPGGLRVSVAATITGIHSAGEGGLLGIAVSPTYDDDGLIFAYHTTATDNRIVRFTLGGQPEPILTGIPRSRIHNGGRLAFGPDGHLYAGTGDAGTGSRSQDLESLAGKVLRLTTEGEPAPDNPFGDSHVWAYGLRNVQGLAWDAGGQLWATDFGADDFDELNRIEAGGNYGWPLVEGPAVEEPADPPAADEDTDEDTDGDPAGELLDPVVAWPPAEASCSGAAVIGSTLVAACLRGQRLWLVDLTERGTVLGAPRPALVEEYGRLRTVAAAPDGSVWVTTSNRDGRLPGGARDGDDRIIRLVVSGGGGDRVDLEDAPADVPILALNDLYR